MNQTLQLPRECPIERLEVTISVPQSQKLGIQMDQGYNGIDFGHFDVEQDDHFYSLTGTNLPQTFTDAYLPAAIYPTLQPTTRYTVLVIYTNMMRRVSQRAVETVAQCLHGHETEANVILINTDPWWVHLHNYPDDTPFHHIKN